jgi:hypothetical protein
MSLVEEVMLAQILLTQPRFVIDMIGGCPAYVRTALRDKSTIIVM